MDASELAYPIQNSLVESDSGNLLGSYFVTLRRQSLQATGVNPAILSRIKLCHFSHSFYLERLHASERYVHAAKKPETFLKCVPCVGNYNILPCEISLSFYLINTYIWQVYFQNSIDFTPRKTHMENLNNKK